MVVTISDTRTIETDKSGNLIIELLENAGHVVEKRKIIPDQPEKISQVIEEGAHTSEVDAIITTGGTGIAARDVTIEVVQKMLDKEI
ncbi:MogA/MoaB family molybdenum cofactor biosynthesis protein, partial [Salmonella enterica]|uniref:MogA/MoaB family molybdenum cofactor biosynthesis protein n=1 Tax=Salmonella enterica TaxID=28901 RepID=UPI003CF2D19F